MSSTRTIEEAVCSQITHQLRGLHVSMPGRVERYNKSTQRADIQPLIQRAYIDENGNRQVESFGLLTNVPIVFQRAAAFTMTFPIAKGDGVMVMFSDFSIDRWLKHGGLVDPIQDRNHALSDAYAIAGLHHDATDQVHDTAAVLAGDLRLGSKDATELAAFQSELKAMRDDLEGHTHGPGSFTNSGGSVTGLSGSHTGIPDPVGATKVWLE